MHHANMSLHLQAFWLIECGVFRCLLRFCQPMISEKDTPHHKTLRAEILWHAQIVEERVHASMSRALGKISFTFNAWTFTTGDLYLSLTAHYIYVPTDKLNAWELKSEQLMFQEIHGRHTGVNMAAILGQALDRYRLHGKVQSSSHLGSFLSC